MKKSLVVVALAGAMAFTAAQAETVLYGSVRLGAEVAKNHTNADGSKAQRGLDMQDFGSRVGLRGSEDLGNGTKVLFQLEWGFNGMEGTQNGTGFQNRLAWLGLSGDWGTVALGRQNNPFTEALNANTEADNFNGNGTTSALRVATGEVVFGEAMPTRVGNSIAYVSPSFSGFNFVVAGIADAPKAGPATLTVDNNNDVVSTPGTVGSNSAFNKNKGLDIYTVALNYNHESGFYAKAAYLGADLSRTQKRADAYGINVGFANEQFGVNADFGMARQGRFAADTARSTSTGWDLGGHFSFGPDYFSTVRATVGQAKLNEKFANGVKDSERLTTWAVGFEQKLSTRTQVWAEFAKHNYKEKDNRVKTASFNDEVFSVGIRHDF